MTPVEKRLAHIENLLQQVLTRLEPAPAPDKKVVDNLAILRGKLRARADFAAELRGERVGRKRA